MTKLMVASRNFAKVPKNPSESDRAGPRHVGQATNFAPIQTDLIKSYCLGEGWRTLLGSRAQTTDNFRRSSFACGKFSLVAPHFRLF